MCKCKKSVGVILSGAGVGCGLLVYTVWMSLIAGSANTTTGELTLLCLMFVSKVANSGFYIYYAIAQSIEALRINWFAYMSTTSLENVCLIIWVILYNQQYGFNNGGFYIYLAFGAGLASKILINILGITNMESYMEELKEKEEEELFGFEAFQSKTGLTLVVLN